MHDLDTIDQRFATGDDSALRAAYDAHGALVYSLCRRAVGDDLAADITQEVFVTAWRRRSSFDPARGALGAWLTGITRNKIVDVLRREARHRNERLDSAGALADASDPDEWVGRLGDRMLVAEALASLPERCREVVRLAFVDDLTQQQIADRTGHPLGTVKSDVRRGLARLRHYLHPSNGDPDE